LTDEGDIESRSRYHPREDPEKDKAVGFKLMYDQLEHYSFLKKLIKSENLHVIHLIRKNALKIYLSRLTKRKRGIAHSVYRVEEVKVWVNPKTVLNHLSWIVSRQEKMRLFLYNPYLEITSEYFFNNHSEASKKIFDFLGVDQCEVRLPSLKKLNPDSTRQVIENYDEIAQILRGTPYECFLD
jgi:hypothetical protein